MGLVISELYDVRIALIEDVSLLDPVSIEDIGRRLYRLVDEEAIRKVVVDFRRVRFLSSQMIGVVLKMHKKAEAIKGKVVFCGMTEKVHEGFRVTRLDKILNIADDETRAVSLLNPI